MMRRYAAVTDQTLRAAAEAVSGIEPATAAQVRAQATAASNDAFVGAIDVARKKL